MAKLVLSLGGAFQAEFPLNKERMTIGRKPDNDVQVDNLAVSGKHALIITILDDSFVEDLGSTNGTYVNGKLIKKHALRHGDVIGIGKHEVRYVNEHATADDEELEKTIVMKPGSASAAAAIAKALGRAAPAAREAARPHRPHRRKATGAGQGLPHARATRRAGGGDLQARGRLFLDAHRGRSRRLAQVPHRQRRPDRAAQLPAQEPRRHRAGRDQDGVRLGILSRRHLHIRPRQSR